LGQGHDWLLDCVNGVTTNQCQGRPYNYYCDVLGNKRKVLLVYFCKECECRRLSGAASIFCTVPGPACLGLGKSAGKEKGEADSDGEAVDGGVAVTVV
jgi:hypothetical protein